MRAAGEVYIGWRGARGEGRGVGYERLGAKAGRECLAGPGARDEWAASGSRCGARGSRRRAMRGVENDGFGAKGGVACLGSAPIYPTIQGKPREPTQGDTRRLPGRVLARGITDGYVTTEYRHGSQGSRAHVKGIWELAWAASQAQHPQCMWSLLFHYYGHHPDPQLRYGADERPANTWRRPTGGIACIAQYNRWPGRNSGAERAVRLAAQHRDLFP